MTVKYVTVFEAEQYDGKDWPPDDLTGFINWFLDKTNSIPVEHRKNAVVDLAGVDSYGSAYAYLKIYYTRPETDEEVQVRQRADEFRQNHQERLERETFARLQAKYGEPRQ